MMNPQFKKIKDPLPNYKGPYNKELIQSEISLVDLIDNETHQRLKKLGKKQPLEPGNHHAQPKKPKKTQIQNQPAKTKVSEVEENASSRARPLSSRKYDPASYKTNPYKTKD